MPGPMCGTSAFVMYDTPPICLWCTGARCRPGLPAAPQYLCNWVGHWHQVQGSRSLISRVRRARTLAGQGGFCIYVPSAQSLPKSGWACRVEITSQLFARTPGSKRRVRRRFTAGLGSVSHARGQKCGQTPLNAELRQPQQHRPHGRPDVKTVWDIRLRRPQCRATLQK